MFLGYHSLPKAGTEYTPQWMKMPNLASRYHSGTEYCSSEAQVGSNGPAGASIATMGSSGMDGLLKPSATAYAMSNTSYEARRHSRGSPFGISSCPTRPV